jgi:exopolysaccharide biosynthesis polyprenyl glycosylphosphotransferase
VPKLLTFWCLAFVGVSGFRGVARSLCRLSDYYLQNTLIVGTGKVGQLIARKLLAHPEYGINLVGFIDDQPKEPRPDLDGLTILGPPDNLAAIADELDIERVIVAFSNDSTERTIDLVRSLHRPDIQVDVVPRLFDLVGPSCEIHSLEGVPLLGIPSLRLSRASRTVKRALDLALSLGALIVLSPLFALVAIAIKIDTPGPIFFRQRRMGEEGRPFSIFKFRTMGIDAEARKAELVHLNKHLAPGSDPRMFKIPDDPRITRVGKILRRYSIDELPQLINVVEGKMSLVGPRPLIPEESQHVDTWAQKRMDLKPGITGLWQVLGRSDIPFEEMVKLDYLYVTTWSLWQDISLMFRTIPVAAASRGGSY